MKYLKYSSSFLVAFAFFLLFIISITFFVVDWIKFIITPLVPPHKSFDYILPTGGSIRVLSHDLSELGLLKYPQYLELLAYMKGYANHLHAGEYHFEAGETPDELLKQIIEGRVLWRKITFVEGSTFSEILEQLENNPLIVHNLAGFPPMVIMMKLNLWKMNIHPEGLFFPDTYQYTAGMSDKTILLTAYKLMQKKLDHEWENRAHDVPYQSSYQALIAASIIEKEAKLSNEREEISGVIKRRLQKNMLLQMDPTVIYAIEESGVDFHPPLKRESLKIDSLYNTYMYKGLPPTPICMPGEESIHAALHPIAGSALYYVSRGDGTLQFSATYSQHLKAVEAYERK